MWKWMVVAAMLSWGSAHASGAKPGPASDKGEQLLPHSQRMNDPVEARLAPGEAKTPDTDILAARKREMARRLLWLMLSAR